MVESLPVFLTPLIGREQELVTLEQLLHHSDVRLVTITGPGGVGKTRLAVAAASSLADDFPGAIAFVSLVPITEPAFVLPAIMEALGIQGGEDDSHTSLERITHFIHKKTYLLILDNFEHIIEAASAIPEMLAACPNLKIIVTSRQNLHVRGEQEFAVPLLGLPDIERLAHSTDLGGILARYPAVRLFLERMQAIRLDYEPDQAALRAIAAICVHLDGLPLAIELAAPRTHMFTPEQLLTQLSGGKEFASLSLLSGGARDLPARQRTLSRTIKWSYDLLSSEEQRVFRAMSTFADTFTLSEAENLLSASLDGPLELPLGDLIASLIDKNLLRQADSGTEPRFRMLVMLQEFGRAEAERLGETLALQAAHAETFLELAEASIPKLYTREQIDVTARLLRDVDNLRQGLRWALDQDELEIAARFGVALWRFWALSGLLSEGQGWLKEILTGLGYNLDRTGENQGEPIFPPDQAPEIERLADLLYGLGQLGYHRSGGGRSEVIRWLTQSRDLYLHFGDRTKAALAMTALAQAMLFQHENLDVSQSLLEESYQILQAAGHKVGMADNLYVQARSYFYLNQPDEADEAMRRSLDLLDETGNIYTLAYAKQFAGDLVYGKVGGYGEVRRHYAEAAEAFAALGNVTEAAVSKAIAGFPFGLVDGDWQDALALVEEGIRIAREHSNERAVVLCQGMAASVYAFLGRIEEAKSVALEAIRTAFRLSDHAAIGIAFIGLANAERLAGDYTAAVATISALMSYRTYYKSLVYSRGNTLHVTSLSQMQQELDSETFDQAWARGPVRLAELLSQVDALHTSWPLAAVPRMDAPEFSEHGETEKIYVSKGTAATSPLPEPLTTREKDVLNYLVQGMTDPQIAEALVISPRTVHAHLRNIYNKLGVNSRTAATRLALERGLV